MALSIIRAMTPDDSARVYHAAARFLQRHFPYAWDNTTGKENPAVIVQYCIEAASEDGDKRLPMLWQKAFCRALRLPYDRRLTDNGKYIGVRVD